MDIDIFKNENHNKYLLDLSKNNKELLEASVDDIQAKTDFNQRRIIKVVSAMKSGMTNLPSLPKILWVYTEHAL